MKSFLIKESDWVNIQSYSINEIKQLENIGIPWSGYFANLNWLPTIAEKLIDSKKVFRFYTWRKEEVVIVCFILQKDTE